MDNQTPKTDFSVSLCDSSPVLQIPKRLTVLEAVTFKEKVTQILANSSLPRSIHIDFNLTEFIDSSGIGALVYLYKLSQEKNVELSLLNVKPPVMAVLKMTALDQVFKIIELNSPSTKTEDRPDLSQVPETHPSVKSLIKRLLDIVGSLVGLAITAVLFIPIAISIKIDSPGPIFFNQERCGWMGKRFAIIKFRSMCNDAEALKAKISNDISDSKFFKNKEDPRITRVGKFLRKTSLDELPQFWNVLKGEMSLVGTRPPTPDEVEKYEVPEWQRLNVKPGMTGEWQVYGRSKVRSFEDVIRLDLEYQKKWSLWYDLELILKTILVIFRKNSGAV